VRTFAEGVVRQTTRIAGVAAEGETSPTQKKFYEIQPSMLRSQAFGQPPHVDNRHLDMVPFSLLFAI
jgi:hypothetical protein